MTQNRRIALNVMATYGRSLLALFCGIFTSRWVLQSLGVKAYGVYAVTGVIITFMTMLNGFFATSVSRFFAVAVGKFRAQGSGADAIEECRKWFSVAVMIHLVMPIALILIGAPIGFWAIKNYFVIPPEYLETSYWVLSFSIVMAFVSMAGVPFYAMYSAKQEIAEMTLYSIATTIANLGFAFSLLHYHGDRLWYHAFYGMLLAVAPNVLVIFRALRVYPECVIRWRYMRDLGRVKDLAQFAGWLIVGSVAMTLQGQGMVTAVNRFLGIEFNASMNVAQAVVGHSSALSNALTGAFSPAIQNAAGAGNRTTYERYAVNACKFGTVLCAIFVCPVSLEVDYLVRVWLVNPPPMVAELCVVMLFSLLIDKTCTGMISAIHANGRIMLHEVMNSIGWIAALGVGWFLIGSMGGSVLVVPWVRLWLIVVLIVQRAFLWKCQLGFALRPWLFGFIFPTALAVAVSMALGVFVRSLMEPSVVRLLLGSAIQVLFLSMLFYGLVLTAEDRAAVISRIRLLGSRFRGRR